MTEDPTRSRLMLQMKMNEAVHIGEDIVIYMIKTDRGRKRMIIELPRTMVIRRVKIKKRLESKIKPTL